ncbi:MAG: bifunctional trypsin-like peptidase domain-containing/SEL1-like repeat protein [Bdellovibrionales bacterium]|nr:bifunctional trypsin-like peptidase domain-containing/SEL1-like repeat protein [Bdellovibrionales bacterium]
MINIKAFLLMSFLLSVNSVLSEPSFPEPVQQTEHAIYEIQKISAPQGGSTVFFITPNLFILNFHSVTSIGLERDHFEDIKFFQQGQIKPLKIKRVIAVSVAFDLVLIETQNTSDHYLEVNPQTPKSSEDLFTIGYPRTGFTQLKKTGPLFKEDYQYCFTHEAFIGDSFKGASGSPALNSQGEVIGVIHETLTGANMTCAINPDKINQLVENKIGTNCSSFESVKSCIESELNSIENSSLYGDDIARYTGMRRVISYHQGVHELKTQALIHLIDYTLKDRESLHLSSIQELTENIDVSTDQTDQLDMWYFYWVNQSAEHGNAIEQYKASQLYIEGKGVEPNVRIAFYMAKQAARQGFAPAQHQVGLFYANGEGTQQNHEQAMLWMEKSAEQGFIPAQLALALYYYDGIGGIQQNIEQAFYWIQQASRQGDPEAQYLLGIFYINEQEEQKAFDWMQKSAQRGNVFAQHNLSYFYSEGYGTQQDIQQALYWMEQSAQQDFMLAQKDLAFFYSTGHNGIPTNPEKAFYWVQQAARQGDPESQYSLFKLYANGEGTPKNIQQALYWLEQSAEQDYTEAQLTLEELTSKPSFSDWLQDLFK